MKNPLIKNSLNQLKRLSTPAKMWVWIITTTAVFFGSVIIILLVAWPILTEKRDAIETARANQATSQSTVSSVISLSKRAKELEKINEQLTAAFVSKHNPLDMVTRLETLADEHKVITKITLANPPSDANDEKIISVDMTLDIEGNFSDVISYTDAIMTEPFYLGVKSVSLESPEKKNGTTTSADYIVAELQINTYWK